VSVAACRDACARLGVPFRSVRITVGPGNVQAAARTAWEERRSLREVLDQDDRVTGTVPAAALDEAFSLDHSLRNVGLVFQALEEVDL